MPKGYHTTQPTDHCIIPQVENSGLWPGKYISWVSECKLFLLWTEYTHGVIDSNLFLAVMVSFLQITKTQHWAGGQFGKESSVEQLEESIVRNYTLRDIAY